MNEGHLERLERSAGIPGLAALLAERLPPADLQSLLLEVYRRRAGAQTPAQLLKRYRESRFCSASTVDPVLLSKLENEAYHHMRPEFTPLQLSPLAPLGACSSIATCDQNKVVGALRHMEVSADPTNSLALEAALRRRDSSEVHLGACQRVVRAQSFPDAPGFFAHFGLVGLGSSSRDAPAALKKHLTFHHRLLGSHWPERELKLQLTPLNGVGNRWSKSLLDAFPGATLDHQRESGRGYYRFLCFKLYLDGLEVGDGGVTDWTAQLLGNAKEHFVISGLGMERLVSLW